MYQSSGSEIIKANSVKTSLHFESIGRTSVKNSTNIIANIIANKYARPLMTWNLSYDEYRLLVSTYKSTTDTNTPINPIHLM